MRGICVYPGMYLIMTDYYVITASLLIGSCAAIRDPDAHEHPNQWADEDIPLLDATIISNHGD